MIERATLAEQLRWEAVNLRAMRLWLMEPESLVAVATRIEAVADALCEDEENVTEAAE